MFTPKELISKQHALFTLHQSLIDRTNNFYGRSINGNGMLSNWNTIANKLKSVQNLNKTCYNSDPKPEIQCSLTLVKQVHID